VCYSFSISKKNNNRKVLPMFKFTPTADANDSVAQERRLDSGKRKDIVGRRPHEFTVLNHSDSTYETAKHSS
jgi:hypothetical protein